MSSEFADEVVNECISHYHNLGKKGKPILGKEWTLLSSIVMSFDGKLTVLAMATGTKCLGRSEMSQLGDLVNDSHAEVLARRCFLRYLYDQIFKFQSTGTSDIIIGFNEKKQYVINPEVKFHFYSSHVPCGDASIIPKHSGKRKNSDIDSRIVKRKNSVQTDLKYKIQNSFEIKVENDENLNKSTSQFEIAQNDLNKEECVNSGDDDVELCSKELEDCVGEVVDIHRTGAKCLQGEDRKLPGALYHQVCAVRTKPGRGDPTLSVSCSDKMTRWIACGLQGALLSLLLSQPVMLTSVVIGGGGQYSEAVLKRALLSRSGLSHTITLLHSSVVFPHSRYSAEPSSRPCPSAILWARVTHKPLEVCVEGRRQGATKKCRDNGRLMICKLELLRSFLVATNNIDHRRMSYRALKALANRYNNTWMQVKRSLTVWTSKPQHLEDFKVDSIGID